MVVPLVQGWSESQENPTRYLQSPVTTAEEGWRRHLCCREGVFVAVGEYGCLARRVGMRCLYLVLVEMCFFVCRPGPS